MTRSSMTDRRVRALWALLVVGLSSICVVAEALERPPAPNTSWEVPAVPFPDGLYVIGDSISFAVPYVETGAALGEKVWQRAGFGWSTFAHRSTLWGQTGLSSFEDAARSPANVVFVQLGTNDTACMRGGGLCFDDYPKTAEAQNAERFRMLRRDPRRPCSG